eukprot:TRINITY_DN20701_c0_g2_i1.p1 TRINITY_DN20701_c0_g2~~TRINITY_DN20701_c0_g2_i1.p1  ORF type:complete len:453 (+),score=139.39 TRINITY_DN20701_c0_g2_i1:90-1361(+)
MGDISKRRLCVLGAGPGGLELAVAAARAGAAVTVLERGEVGASMQQWGHVTLFSPLRLNVSPHGRAVLQELGRGIAAEEGEAFMTGAAHRERYLVPLAEWLARREGCELLCHTEAVSVARGMLSKSADIGGGKGLRPAAPFRVLVRCAKSGAERFLTGFDALVDATGSYQNHGWVGPGGLPAVGEAAAAEAISYQLPDVAAHPERYGHGRTTCVIGSGASAITTIAALRALGESGAAGAVRVEWICRQQGAPYTVIPGDPLPQRRELYQLGNDIAAGSTAQSSPSFAITHHAGRHVAAVARRPDGGCVLSLWDEKGAEKGELQCDNICAHVGFRPDLSLTRELQVHYCYATEGPMKLAAAMMAASGSGGGDCLKQVTPGADTMLSPEPSFFILGMKSVGRGSTYLMRTGVEQVAHILELLGRG